MTDLAAPTAAGDLLDAPHGCPNTQFQDTVDRVRDEFRSGLVSETTLPTGEVDAVVRGLDKAVLEIGAAMIAHQVMTKPPVQRPFRLQLVRDAE